MQNVGSAPIDIEVDMGDSTIYVTELLTNDEGSADLLIESGYALPADDEGLTTILASFGGNDTLKSSSTDFEIKDVFLDINFAIEDSTAGRQVLPVQLLGVYG